MPSELHVTHGIPLDVSNGMAILEKIFSNQFYLTDCGPDRTFFDRGTLLLKNLPTTLRKLSPTQMG